MLKLFEVTGFKNFKDTFTLDFSDVRDYQFNSDCISDGLIGKMIIYGRNAIGKTNFGLALFDIASHLSTKNATPRLYDYYLNTSCLDNYASFRYVFQFGNTLLEYHYRKDERKTLLYAKLMLDSKILHEYDYTKKKGDISGIHTLAPTLNMAFLDDDPILRHLVNNTILDDSHPLRQLMRFVSNMLWFRSLDDNRYI